MKEVKEYFDINFFNKFKQSDYVGVEIEIPIINCKKPYTIDSNEIEELFKYLTKNGFRALNYDNLKHIIAVKSTNGDTISLEYSLNTIELSLNKELNIYDLMNKFIKYYDLINSFIEKYNYKLYCGGINPNYRKINRNCLNQNRYKTIERLLKTNKKNIFSEFCSYCCSIQTHINTSQEELVNTINMFTKIEDIKTKIFANSYMDELNLKNSRKYLWEHCNFGPHNSGKNKIYKSLEELKRSYLYRDLFFVERDDKFLLLNEKIPVYKFLKEKELDATDESLKDYKVVPNINDLDNFRSYKSVEVTRFGTLEIRTDCTQSFEKIFKVVAFNVGVTKKCNEILEYLKKNKRISTKKLLEYACLGLKERGKEEEILLKE